MSIIQEIKDNNANTVAKQRSVAFNYLFDNAKDDVMVGKFYLFEYNPKTKFLNSNVKIPLKLLHRYIGGRADRLFFEVPEEELVEFAALPIEQFYDSKNRFVSKKKVQLGSRK